jgi:hypothetical protein
MKEEINSLYEIVLRILCLCLEEGKLLHYKWVYKVKTVGRKPKCIKTARLVANS